MRLSLAMICRDEERTIKPCLESCIDIVDEVILVDTGSKDKTLDVAQEVCGDKLRIATKEWTNDFSAPRNLSFTLASGDFILWLDCDDTLANPAALRKFIEDNQDTVDVVHLMYDYAKDEFGNLAVVHWRDRVIRNLRNPDGSCAFQWNDRIHEYMRYPEGTRVSGFNESKVIHNRDSSAGNRPSHRNLEILKEVIKDSGGLDKASPRHLVYLGNEYWTLDEMDKGQEAFEAYHFLS